MTYEEMEAIAGLDLEIPEQRERALAWRIEDRPTLEWALGILANAARESLAISAECDAARARIRAVEDDRLGRLERSTSFIRFAAEEYARLHRKELLVKGKTAYLVHGEVAYRSSPEKVEIEDPAAALAWCESQGIESGLIRVKAEIDKKALNARVLSTGEIPPGVVLVPPTETITLKPSQPETITARAERKAIK